MFSGPPSAADSNVQAVGGSPSGRLVGLCLSSSLRCFPKLLLALNNSSKLAGMLTADPPTPIGGKCVSPVEAPPDPRPSPLTPGWGRGVG